MNKSKPSLAILGGFLFAVGAMLGFLFFGFSTWADYEASMFASSLPADSRLTGLRCPALITSNETGTMRLTLDNNTQKDTSRRVRAFISSGFVSLFDECTDQQIIPPGGSHTFEWTLKPENAAWNRFILARVYTFPAYPLPSATSTCGVVLLPLPILNGNMVMVSAIVCSILFMGIGLWLWIWTKRPMKDRINSITSAMVVLGGAIIAGMFTALLGWWIPGAFFLLITVLMVVSMLYFFVV